MIDAIELVLETFYYPNRVVLMAELEELQKPKHTWKSIHRGLFIYETDMGHVLGFIAYASGEWICRTEMKPLFSTPDLEDARRHIEEECD